MAHPERVKAFDRLRGEYSPMMTALLWKLTGDREIFAEAMQYALLGMWRHLEKLNGERAPGYLYRIVLSANSRAWRKRIGKDGHINSDLIAGPSVEDCNPPDSELIEKVRKTRKLRYDSERAAVQSCCGTFACVKSFSCFEKEIRQ